MVTEVVKNNYGYLMVKWTAVHYWTLWKVEWKRKEFNKVIELSLSGI